MVGVVGGIGSHGTGDSGAGRSRARLRVDTALQKRRREHNLAGALQIARAHRDTPGCLGLMMEGMIESWQLDQVWKGILADMMEEAAF